MLRFNTVIRMAEGLVLSAMLAAILAEPAYSADATVNFSGQFLPASCTVDSSTANQTVNLQNASVSDFSAVGSTKNATAFNVKLTDCNAGTKVTMTTSGTIDTAPSVLKNTGSATQVGVQLLLAASVGSTSGTPITLNSALDLGAVDASNAMTVPLVAQFYRLGTMTPGTVAATATLSFTYN
jgi:major type 1 subunit fimbrin (pilin)